MSSAQYSEGTCTITNASQIVLGASTDWLTNLTVGDAFKINLDGETVYHLGAITSATRMALSSNYLGSTNSGVDYMVMRDYSIFRSYWKPAQGDKDFAEILSQETIDPIDEDIGDIMVRLEAIEEALRG